MIFKLSKKELFSDNGTFIKKLHCPYLIRWKNMSTVDGVSDKMCSICDKTVFDTEAMSDKDVINLIGQDSDACLKIDLNQKNITMVNIYD